MNRVILLVAFVLSNALSLSAQKITNVEELKRFYADYFTYSISGKDAKKQDSLIVSFCTEEFVKAWSREVKDIGLYDPLTNGFCDDYPMMRKTLSVKKENDSYTVSFDYLTWPDNKTMTESVIVYINVDGKISHTKRPSDGYMTPKL